MKKCKLWLLFLVLGCAPAANFSNPTDGAGGFFMQLLDTLRKTPSNANAATAPIINVANTVSTLTEGNTATIGVKLTGNVTQNYIVTITSSDPAIQVAGGTSTTLTFTSANFSVDQSVVLTASDDLNEISESVIISFSALTLNPVQFSLNTLDNNRIFPITLNLNHSSATGANKFAVMLSNSLGQIIAKLATTTTLSAGKTYSGNLKAADPTTGAILGTDAQLGYGTYSLFIYADTDGSNTVNLAGDKTYLGNVIVSGNTTVTINNTDLITPIDLDIQYAGGILTAYNTKNALCAVFPPGIASTITSAATLVTARAKHLLGLPYTTIVSGSFSGSNNATITKGHVGWARQTH